MRKVLLPDILVQMSKTTDLNESSIITQLRQVLKDALDYAQSVLILLQARATELALSSIFFLLLFLLGGVLFLTALVLLSVALGFWINQFTGNVSLTLLIMGLFYAVGAYVCGRLTLGWLNRLKS